MLIDSVKELIANFFHSLINEVRKADYYKQIYRLLGNDGSIEQNLKLLENQITDALVNLAQTECDRYVREQPAFYTEGTCAMWQLRETLKQTCKGYDYESLQEAEPAIRQLLQLDFEPKVSETTQRSFRQRIYQVLNRNLLPRAEQQADEILQQYNQARTYLEKTLEKEAEEKIKNNQRFQDAVKQKIDNYNQSITVFNSYLEAIQLDRKKLPLIEDSELTTATPTLEFIDKTRASNEVLDSENIVDEL